MAATTNPSADDAAPRPEERFDGAERLVHWTTAVLFFVCVLSATALYVNSVAAVVGRRELVKAVHVYAGLALPLPLVVGLAGRWGRRLRVDARRLNRWRPIDWQWFRAGRGRWSLAVGKFNGGQKLNAAFDVGAALLMLVTGVIMRWFAPFPLSWRTGATFVHDWIALAFVVVIGGHIWMAATHRIR